MANEKVDNGTVTGRFRAKEDCYTIAGYKSEGDVFDYTGPKHDSLELVKDSTPTTDGL